MPSPTAPKLFDRELQRHFLRRARRTATPPDFLFERASEDLAERLSIIKRDFSRGLLLADRSPVIAARLTALENVKFVCRMSEELDAPDEIEQTVLGDEEALPFQDGSFDLIVSVLSLHLVNDVPGVLAQAARALKPDGLLLAAMLGSESLTELRQSWLLAEEEIRGGVSPRVAPFADVRTLGSLLQRAGLALPVADNDTVTVRYASPLALMYELRAMGATNALAERSRVPVTKRLLQRVCEIYIDRFASPDGRIPATFEIVTLTGWAPDASQPKPLQPGSAKTRLATALGVKEIPTDDKAGN